MQKFGVGAWGRRGGLIALTMTTMIAAGCGGGGGGSSGGGSASSASGANRAPTISGTPADQIAPGASYSLVPTATDADGDALAFSIQNKPSWAVFNTATGELRGVPTAANVGAFNDVVISVSDGKASASLPAFSITVAQGGTSVPGGGASVALAWDVPTTTVDGATLADLTGYRIHYGHRRDRLWGSIEIQSAGANRYVVQGLPRGTYYFAVRAITANGSESDISNVVSRVIG